MENNLKGKSRSRLKRWLKRLLVSLLIITVVLVFGVLPYLFAVLITNAGTRPIDRALTSSPAEFGADFKDVEFQSADGIKISGWLLASRGRGATIIYSHGLFRSRREMLDRAAVLWKLGYGALLYDERNHGESGKARTSLGYLERLDALGAVRFLRETNGEKEKLVLFGISMGATADLLAAAESNEVSAVVSDSAFLSLEETVAHHVRLFFRIPAFPIANEIEFFVERRAGFDGEDLNALEAVKRIGDRPVLFIAGERDKRIPPDIARRLHAASISQKSDLLIIDAPGTEVHGRAYPSAPDVYIKKAAAFLEAALQ